MFAHKPNPDSDVIFLRFYIYSDNEDSKKVGDVIGYNSTLLKKSGSLWREWAHVQSRDCLGQHRTALIMKDTRISTFLKLKERILESLFE